MHLRYLSRAQPIFKGVHDLGVVRIVHLVPQLPDHVIYLPSDLDPAGHPLARHEPRAQLCELLDCRFPLGVSLHEDLTLPLLYKRHPGSV